MARLFLKWSFRFNPMKVENFRSENKGNRARVVATMSWEDCDRPAQELCFETDQAFAGSLSCNPHAFLLAGAIPAMHYGEERIFIDAEICPELRTGLTTAMSWIRHWFGPDREPVRIEAKTRSNLPTPHPPERAGFLFSGGIDSFATLYTNRLNFPLKHPWSIKDGLLIYGLELDSPEAFEYVVSSLSGVAQNIGITLIPVYTNIYLQYRCEDAENHWRFWKHKFQGSVLAAVAHAFRQRLTVVSIASGLNIPNLRPWGTHPLLDPNYSSSDLRIRHDGITLSRLAKTKLVTEWDVPLQYLRVCNQYKRYRPGKLNCGECGKCVQTMLTLLALGALDRTRAFPRNDISEELLLAKAHLKTPYEAFSYQELMAHLAEKGRCDLVHAVKYKVAEYYDRPKKTNNWKTRIKEFDRRYLDGNLKRLIPEIIR